MTKGLFAAAVLLLTARIGAHHSFASEYDANRPVTVSGTVTRFDWTNPHAWLAVEQKQESGRIAVWNFEMGSPNGMRRRGWSPRALKKGDQVTVEGYRAKDGRNVANSAMVQLPDGRKLFGGFQTTPHTPSK